MAADVAPGGYGPWFCGFLVNTGNEPKKHTHVVVHAMPHLIADALNRPQGVAAGTEQSCWILVLKIGPFVHWKDGVAFLQLWLRQTRGKIHRIERGIELFCQYRERYSLYLWSQTRHRDAAVAHWQNLTPWISSAPSPLGQEQGILPDLATAAKPTNDKRQLYQQWLERKRDFVQGSMLIGDLRTFQKTFVLNGSDFLLGWLTGF